MKENKSKTPKPLSTTAAQMMSIHFRFGFVIKKGKIELTSAVLSSDVAGSHNYANKEDKWSTLEIPLLELEYSDLEMHVSRSIKKFLKRHRSAIWEQ